MLCREASRANATQARRGSPGAGSGGAGRNARLLYRCSASRDSASSRPSETAAASSAARCSSAGDGSGPAACMMFGAVLRSHSEAESGWYVRCRSRSGKVK